MARKYHNFILLAESFMEGLHSVKWVYTLMAIIRAFPLVPRFQLGNKRKKCQSPEMRFQ